MEEPVLTRRERRKLAKEEKRLMKEKTEAVTKHKKGGLWIIVLLLVVAGIWWLFRDSSKPLPGESVDDIGRDHVTDIAGIEYNSNPPTSGTHFAVWAKNGVYDRMLSDGYLIHSLEHGYVILSYDCTKEIKLSKGLQFPKVANVLAHDEPAEESTDSGVLLKHMDFQPTGGMSWFTPENAPEAEVELPGQFNTDDCRSLVSELSDLTKVAERVIVVPRIEMDTLIALTAWGRIEKLESFDEVRIRDFIRSFHNKGPEKTME